MAPLIAILAVTAALSSVEAPVCAVDYAAIKAAQLETIESGIAVYGREQDETKWTPAEREAFDRAISLQERRDLIVDKADLEIVDGALALLADEEKWDREDDRQCDNDGGKVSLFCALVRSSVDVTGEYRHRRTALQEVRFAVEEASEGKDYAHRMMDFNNDPETSLDDVRAVIVTAKTRIASRLKQQGDCELNVEGEHKHG